MSIAATLRKCKRVIVDSDYRTNVLASLRVYNRLDDKKYLEKIFKANMGYALNLINPQTFNEKLQWLKLYNRRPEYTTMVDKYLVRDYIAEKLGEEYLIPLLGVWDDPDEIDFAKLPEKFVLKCNHNSGLGMCICKDKSKLDIAKVKSNLKKGLKQDYYLTGREWPYKDVPRKIIAEQYMEDNTFHELRDYKFFCFGGQVKCFKVDFDRFIEHRANYFDTAGNLLKFGEVVCPPVFDRQIVLPKTLPKMIEFAEALTKSIPFLRADFYDVNGKIYFGELTFYPASGMGKFIPDEWDKIFGEWISLPISGGGYALITDDYIAVLQCSNDKGLKDYKFFCFNGEPKFTLVCSERFSKSGLKEDFYDTDWKRMPMKRPNHDNAANETPKPEHYDLMCDFARKLSKDIPFVRCDFYEINNKVYFGELTFFPASGLEGFTPAEWDKTLGGWIELPD